MKHLALIIALIPSAAFAWPLSPGFHAAAVASVTKSECRNPRCTCEPCECGNICACGVDFGEAPTIEDRVTKLEQQLGQVIALLQEVAERGRKKQDAEKAEQ